jgi:hypothetical protein
VNASELFEGLAAIRGAREAGGGDGVLASRLVAGVEYALVGTSDENKLRAAWRKRHRGGAVPLVLLADDPDVHGRLRLLGPQSDGPVRTLDAATVLSVVADSSEMKALEAIRHVAREVDRLDREGVAGLTVRGLGTEYLYRQRLRTDERRWSELTGLAEAAARGTWRETLESLGYEVERLDQGYLLRATGAPALVVHPYASPDMFARLGEEGRLPEGALAAACRAHNVRFGLLAAGSRLRLLPAGADEAGATTRFLELDVAALDGDDLPLLGLLHPRYLVEGEFDAIQREARDHGAELRRRLDRSVRQGVLPVLGIELGRWAQGEGRDLEDDEVRADLEAAALTFVFRALFLLYAESRGFLPMTNNTYAQHSLTRLAERAAEERDVADPRATSLWREVQALVDAMRTGQSAWGVPAYNGELFAADGFAGADVLEKASIPDAPLVRALVALARDPDDHEIGLDFSGLEIGHLGHIYEGLLSLRLSLADRPVAYDERSDRYVAAGEEEAEIDAGQLLWLTNEGGRKGGGVFYTRSELVRHLVKGAVRPAFTRHLDEVKEKAQRDPEAAAGALFDFAVLDPSCGSAHFLVEVVDEIADGIATLLGEQPMPLVRDELEKLRAATGGILGAPIEDTDLLKRLVLKRCVYGVDLSPMGAEIAKVSLWLASFVPGLSLAYLDHNVRVGNSLIGVAQPEDLRLEEGSGAVQLFDDALAEQLKDAAARAAELRAIDDLTPDEVQASADAHEKSQQDVGGARALFDLWTAEDLGVAGARRVAREHGVDLTGGERSRLPDEAAAVLDEATAACLRQRALHWPLAFAEVFNRGERSGFDVVVGNPPWEEVDVEELGFYARYRPGIRSLPQAERSEAIGELLDDRPELSDALAAERERLAAMRAYLAAAGYASGAGDPDLYKFFCKRYGDLLSDGGWLGVVLPRSAFAAKGSYGFREWLFSKASPRRIDFLLNRRSWMFDTHPQYTIALLAAENVSLNDSPIEIAGVATSSAEFARQAGSSGLAVQPNALGRLLEIPLVRNQAAADLLAKLREGDPFPFGCGRWRCFPVREFDETNDAHLWEKATDGRQLWKGESFDQFKPHGEGARLCPESDAVLAKARKPRPGAGSLVADELTVEARRAAVARDLNAPRLVFRDVSRATDSRTVRACLTPPCIFLTNKAPYLAFEEPRPHDQAACLALMNSLPFDWQARRFAEVSLNFFILEGLHLPTLDDDQFAALVHAGARLSCLDDRFIGFAEAVGVDCGPLDDEARVALRVGIDALVAIAWGLTADELEVVFGDFTDDAVPPSYRERVRQLYAEMSG